MPLLDWEHKARPLLTFESDLTDGQDEDEMKYTSESAWPKSKGATTTQPSPTSTRFIIVSTNNSWKTRVYDVINEDTQTINSEQAETAKLPANYAAQIRKKRVEDGRQSNQATRPAKWIDHSRRSRSVTMVCDLFYASWEVVDELYSGGGADTLTYNTIIEPIRIDSHPKDWPSVTKTTGSALANGITTTMVFANKALERKEKEWRAFDEPAIQETSKMDLAALKKT